MRKKLLAIGLVATACGGSNYYYTPQNGNPSSTPNTRTYTLTDQDVETIIREVAASRQLPAKRTVAVTHLKRDDFVKRYMGGRGDDDSEGGTAIAPDAAFLLGFNFVPEPSKRKNVADMRSVLEEQVAGFYSVDDDTVFIPDIALHSEDDWNFQRAILAHEVEHALQAQHFQKLPDPTSSDEALARRALFEGDAQVAMGATLGSEAGAPVGRTLRRIVEVTKKVPLAKITRGEDRSRLDHALDVARKRLVFPYEEGMMFASDLYRAGGFPLVDGAFAHPPRSTEQILHPERYLAGDQPRPIASPKAPAGYTLVTSDTLGELDTRTLLSRCMDAAVANRAAEGWGGDKYAVFTSARHEIAMAWVTAWDTEEDARDMETALGSSAACWQKNALGLAQNDYVVGDNIRVQRQGRVVLFSRGFADEPTATWFRSLASLVGPEVRAVPITNLKIPERVALPEPHRGTLNGDVYYNNWLGLVARTPPGLVARVDGSLDYMIERPNTAIAGGLAVSTRIANDEQNELTFREVQQALAADFSRMNLRVSMVGTRPISSPLGAGLERSWSVDGTPIQLRMALLPICAGTGSIIILQLDADQYARSVLEGWVNSFRWTNGRNLVACDYLDPK